MKYQVFVRSLVPALFFAIAPTPWPYPASEELEPKYVICDESHLNPDYLEKRGSHNGSFIHQESSLEWNSSFGILPNGNQVVGSVHSVRNLSGTGVAFRWPEAGMAVPVRWPLPKNAIAFQSDRAPEPSVFIEDTDSTINFRKDKYQATAFKKDGSNVMSVSICRIDDEGSRIGAQVDTQYEGESVRSINVHTEPADFMVVFFEQHSQC